MMKKPVLVVMAAGMGSRYGSMKQIDPIDKEGHIIMDFSIYDAVRAGFEKVVFIIKKENEEMFREVIGNRLSRQDRGCLCVPGISKSSRGIFCSGGKSENRGEQDMLC